MPVQGFTCPGNPRRADFSAGLCQNEAADVKTAIKALVTAALLWLLFRSVDLGVVWTLLAGIAPAGVVLAVGLAGLLVFADAVLFVGSMRILGRQVPLSVSLLYSLVGWFFSNVAPSTVGGDLFRSVQMARLGTPVGVAVRGIVIMRVATFASLLAVMLAGLPVAWRLVSDRAVLVPFEAILLAATGGLAALVLMAHVPVPERLQRRWPLIRKIAAAAGDFRKLLAIDAVALTIWTSAMVQHLLRVLIFAALAAALRLDVSFAALFAFAPAALLVAMIPISVGGWGVREAALVFFLQATGATAEAALTLSIAFGLLRMAVGAVGGVVWVLVDKDRFRVDARSA
jgi:uncharacterized membrane protein YbhN (UPF0104 family)